MTPAEVEAIFQSRPPRGPQGILDGQVDAAEHEETRKIFQLEKVLSASKHHWEVGSDELDLFAEKLGDGSRDETWRLAIGKSGLLDFFLSILAVPDLRLPLKIHTLRLIGNSCADTDENRARVVSSNQLSSIIHLLADDSLLVFVIPVLYNICVDYEPAQLQACEACLSTELIGILAGPRLTHCLAFINIVCKILGLMLSQEPEKRLADPETPGILLRLATDPAAPVDLEDFCGLISVALAYLSHEEFQSQLVRSGNVPNLLTAFTNAYTCYDVSTVDADDAGQLDDVRNAFVQAVSDVSALDSFSAAHPIGSPAVQQIQGWLRMPTTFANLQAAACLALGNLARSDESSTRLVRDVQIHRPLIDLLSSSSPSPPPSSPPAGLAPPPGPPPPPSGQLLHAVLSCLKNLAIPPASKPLIGELLLGPPRSLLPRLCSGMDAQPQVQFAAVSLARLLLVGSPDNVRLLCAPPASDPASPAHGRSNLHVLAALHERVDAEPTKMETARAVAAVCRVLHVSGPDTLATIFPDDEWDATAPAGGRQGLPAGMVAAMPPAGRRRASFYDAHAAIDKPLTFLILQTRFPVLRSEAWFVLALMSRDADGASVVARVISSSEATRAIVEAVTGRDMVDGAELPTAARGSAAGGEEEEGQAEDILMAGLEKSMREQAASGQPPLPTSSGTQRATMAGTAAADAVDGLGLSPRQADPAQAASMRRTDRENGLVLLANILRDYAEWIPPFRLSVFQQLVQTGGELVLHNRLHGASPGESSS